MIVVSHVDGSTWVVRQTDHAVMTRDILEVWERPALVPEGVWPLLLEAAEHHDDGWQLEERSPQVDDEGRPVAFNTASPIHHVGIWRRSVDIAGQRDPYVRLLICLHARGLYSFFASETSRHELRFVQQFMDDLSVQIESLLAQCRTGGSDRESAVEPEALAAASRLLFFAEGLSLWMLEAIDSLGHVGAMWFGQSRAKIEADFAAPGRVTLCPWPMVADSAEVSVRGARLVTGRFESDEAFKQTMMDTAWETMHWRLQPGR